MFKGIFAIFSAGGFVIFTAGMFKATWKILYNLEICDFEVLNKCFFPMQTMGFFYSAFAMVAFASHDFDKNSRLNRVKANSISLLPLAFVLATVPKYTSAMPFVIVLATSVVVMDVIFMWISIRLKSPLALCLYIVSVVFVLGMGYLSTKDFSSSGMNWIAQCVNTIGQGAFYAGAVVLHNKGIGNERSITKNV